MATRLPLFDPPKNPKRALKAKMPKPKELALHMAVAGILRDFCKPSWRWTHFPAGEARDARTGAKLKAMGLQPGWPDFILLSPATQGGANGLVLPRFHALECKRLGGVMSDTQSDFWHWAAQNYVEWLTVDSVEMAWRWLETIDCLRVKRVGYGVSVSVTVV